MSLTVAISSAQAVIDNVPDAGLGNGSPYANTAMPTTSHVREYLKWPMNSDGTSRELADHICAYASVDKAKAAHATITGKCEIEVAVIIAIARLAAWRYYSWSEASLSAAEVAPIATNTATRIIHAEHEDEVVAALAKWATPAARYMGLFYYNSISYETSSHHHLPAKTKKLATTTITLSGLKDWIAGNTEREACVFHDCFHPLSDTEKSNAARRVKARQHLSDLKFDNLRKRIPVKAPDSGVAINYRVLFTKARGYRHDPAHLPSALDAPATLAVAVEAYEKAADATALVSAVDKLRKFSAALAEPSAYLAGFILGREANAVGDVDLDLRTAQRTTTILGSPAYARAAGEFSGAFAAGKFNGFHNVSATGPDQVLPRCVAAVATASAI
jgi:hypothetical protein